MKYCINCNELPKLIEWGTHQKHNKFYYECSTCKNSTLIYSDSENALIEWNEQTFKIVKKIKHLN